MPECFQGVFCLKRKRPQRTGCLHVPFICGKSHTGPCMQQFYLSQVASLLTRFLVHNLPTTYCQKSIHCQLNFWRNNIANLLSMLHACKGSTLHLVSSSYFRRDRVHTSSVTPTFMWAGRSLAGMSLQSPFMYFAFLEMVYASWLIWSLSVFHGFLFVSFYDAAYILLVLTSFLRSFCYCCCLFVSTLTSSIC